MNHVITMGGLLMAALLIIGGFMAAAGALALFGAGMSDSPYASASAAKQGCTVGAIGVALILAAVLMKVL